MAARQEALQLQSMITQQKELELTQEQQAGAQLQNYLQQVKSLPFIGADVSKLKDYVRKNIEQPVYNRLKEYGGSLRKWMGTEGAAFMQNANSALLQSDMYKRADQNRLSVEQAREAIKKGEVLIGGQLEGTNNYMPGEAMLSDFLSGKREVFDFHGSYKQEDDMKTLRETYAPGKMPWDIVAVPEAQKLNFLIDTHGREKGMDKYYRQHMGTQVLYKYDPLNKAQEFEWKAEDQAMQRQRHGLAMQLGNQQLGLNQLRAEKLKNDLTGKSDSSQASLWEQMRNEATNEFNIAVGGDPNNVLPLYGMTVAKGDKLFADELGLQRINDKDGGFSISGLKKALTDKGDIFDLSNIKGSVIGIAPKLYYNAREAGPDGSFPNGQTGYARVTVKFNNPYEAEKLGLYDPNRVFGGTGSTSMFDMQTGKGTGIYDPDTQTATFTVPFPVTKTLASKIVGTNTTKKLGADEYTSDDIFQLPPNL